MKIIDSHVRAQSMFGARAGNTAENTVTRHMFTGAAWTAFLMPGALPANEAAVAQIFKQDSLADLYNKCAGVSKGVVSFISKTNIVHLIPQARYFYKGVSFYRNIWGINFRALIPNRILETSASKRTISHLFAGASPLIGADYRPETVGDGNLIVEFDSPVKLTHLVREGTALIFNVNAVADDGTETSLGTWSPMTGDTTMYAASNPQTAKRFRIYATGTFTTMGAITLLSDSQPYTTPPTTLPDWVVVAHTNTRVCGDFQKSPLIPYFAEEVGHGDGTPKPFTLRTLVSDGENILYCPKIRFNNRSL
ncbi:hypothetical protein HOU08_gp080 [Dickeya phage vB_DsoM_JA29]|uniref:Uncharacterized protein n=1 Tax=Dickeya phage vB_DsoM_JA29 TaxID=2283031 RepID=A0A384ZX43_9CAUD|nr:hypothetical protein HOU08_gp080 [Dickeya phage vB_DsoM_JA29]AXG66806.1 hypothetical protein JA29_080 [Dickeya phage vB_DsoM_JA29]